MCKKLWDFLFPKPLVIIPDPIKPVSRRALLYGINKYGGGNDLQGCINDIEDVKTKLNKEFSDFEVTMYKDAEVTGKTFFNTIKEALLVMRSGDILYIHYSGHGTQIPSSQEANGYHEALYLIDGPFIDDQVQTLEALTPKGAIVIAKFDSCFSGNILRKSIGNLMYLKNRFLPMTGVVIRDHVINKFAKSDKEVLRWVVFSGCSEEQTSADAYFDGRYNGAFTYFDNKSYNNKSTYHSEINNIHNYLPSSDYDQSPTIDGDINLMDKDVFL